MTFAEVTHVAERHGKTNLYNCPALSPDPVAIIKVTYICCGIKWSRIYGLAAWIEILVVFMVNMEIYYSAEYKQ